MSQSRYFKILNQLNQVNINKGMKLNLENIQFAAQKLGNPQNKVKYIHVAGTNGKGSVSLKLSRLFQYSGYKSGLYISPHLFSFRERISINENLIEEEYLTENLEYLFKLTEQKKISLTFFEYLTLLSFMYFKDKKVDLAVCEVGLGGLLDATNIIEKPLISVITQIDFDHMSSLGNTLELIAQQKAGIIKKNCPVVLGAEAKPLEIFQKISKIKEAPLYQTKHDSFSNYDYNLENNLTVEKSFQVINKYYPEFKLNQSSLEKALQQNQMCRFEEIKNEIVLKKPSLLTRPFKIFFDVGHNPSGIQKTLQRIKHYFPDKKITIAVGFSMNKEIQDSLLEISKKADKVYFLKANHYRAMDLELMNNQIQQTKNIIDNQHIFQPIIQEANICRTLQTVFEQSQSNEIVLITGSFYLMAEARQFIGYEDLKDPMELQERVIAQENIKTN